MLQGMDPLMLQQLQQAANNNRGLGLQMGFRPQLPQQAYAGQMQAFGNQMPPQAGQMPPGYLQRLMGIYGQLPAGANRAPLPSGFAGQYGSLPPQSPQLGWQPRLNTGAKMPQGLLTQFGVG